MRRLGLVWDIGLCLVFVWNLPAMIHGSWYLLVEQPFDLVTTPAKLPERWILAFFLFSISYYLARPRGVMVRAIYAGVVASFLFQHRIDFGDVVTALIAALAFSPILAGGFGWLGVMRIGAGWVVSRVRRPEHSHEGAMKTGAGTVS